MAKEDTPIQIRGQCDENNENCYHYMSLAPTSKGPHYLEVPCSECWDGLVGADDSSPVSFSYESRSVSCVTELDIGVGLVTKPVSDSFSSSESKSYTVYYNHSPTNYLKITALRSTYTEIRVGTQVNGKIKYTTTTTSSTWYEEKTVKTPTGCSNKRAGTVTFELPAPPAPSVPTPTIDCDSADYGHGSIWNTGISNSNISIVHVSVIPEGGVGQSGYYPDSWGPR